MKFSLLAAGLCCAFTLHAQPILRLSGSTTVKGALEPKQAILEAATGCTLEFAGTGTASGLASLMSGMTDVAMLSSPLDEVARALNEKSPGRVDPAQLHCESLGSVHTLFIVNPHNRVRSVSASQLIAVLDGRVTNWKDVGGADAPIVVVSLANGGSLLFPLLGGHDVAAAARRVANATQIPAVVAGEPNAIGIISAVHPRGQTTVLRTEADVVAPLFLVTKGPPSAPVMKLVHAARKLLEPAP